MLDKLLSNLPKVVILLAFAVFSPMQAGAVEDGEYAGVYQVTFAEPETGERRGNTGQLTLSVKDGKVVEIKHDKDTFLGNKVKYKLKIDSESGRLKGTVTERRNHKGNIIDLRWSVKGVFVDEYFAGSATIWLTGWNGRTPEAGMLKAATYVFESP